MNTITLTIAATPDNLKRLADAFGDCIDETLSASDIPAHRRPTAQDAPKGETVKSAEVEIPAKAEESKTTENGAKAPENGAKAPETEQKAEITLSDLRAKGAELVKSEHREEIKALLEDFRAARIPELKPEDYAEFMRRMEAIG